MKKCPKTVSGEHRFEDIPIEVVRTRTMTCFDGTIDKYKEKEEASIRKCIACGLIDDTKDEN